MATDKVSGTVLSDNLLNTLFLFADSQANILAKVSGYPTGCHFLATDAGVIYENTGDSTTAIWTPKTGSISSDIEFYPYTTTIGDYTKPSSATGSWTYVFDNGLTGGSSTSPTGTLRAMKLTGLTSGMKIHSVGIDIVTAAGNVRVKVYQDNGSGGGPSTLLGESGSTATAGTGFQDIVLTSDATVPASGNVWVAFENDNASLNLVTAVGSAGDSVSHAYGAGPSPFGSITTGATSWHMRATLANSPSAAVDNSTATRATNPAAVANPYITTNMGSTSEFGGVAIYWDGTNSTETQIKIRVSPDGSTWTDVRKINTNLLTDSAWNYIAFNRPIVAMQYLQIYGNSGSSVILSIWEIKVLSLTESQFNRRHGHFAISPTLATLALQP